jgi:hypothetical protein
MSIDDKSHYAIVVAAFVFVCAIVAMNYLMRLHGAG